MSASTSTPVRTGLIGFGYAGRTFHAPLLRTTPGLALVAVASSQTAAVQAALGLQVAIEPDAATLLRRDDIELVVIATPNDSHHPLALAALRAGKAVVVDKPFALTTDQAEELVREAEQRNLLLSVFHNRRWDGDFLTVRQLLASGQLGRIVHAELHFDRFRGQVRERWRESTAAGGGLWIDLGPHLIDQALQLFGTPETLYADIASVRDGAVADDWFHAQLRYVDGLRVTLHASALAAHTGARFVLHGTRGGYRKWGLDCQEDRLKAGEQPDPAHLADWGADPQAGELALWRAEEPGDVLESRLLPTRNGRYPDYYSGVCAALRSGAPNPVPPREALTAMRLLDLGRRSAAERRELPVEEA
ncbi:MAG TPA: oxidoreductase [Ideonella sp.]|uniref:oxidoreductase n=1 Tax=Ideonella sp. TaxID=1929293 RepID=UPI002E351E23|nr:oxidoreductase [Ideonella sp.]HEX5686272.1 oxidoreductase [Ideonella sp.]